MTWARSLTGLKLWLPEVGSTGSLTSIILSGHANLLLHVRAARPDETHRALPLGLGIQLLPHVKSPA